MPRKFGGGESPDYPGKHKNVVYCGDWSPCKHPDDGPGSSPAKSATAAGRDSTSDSESPPRGPPPPRLPAAVAGTESGEAAATASLKSASATGSLAMTSIPEVRTPRDGVASTVNVLSPSGATPAQRAAAFKGDKSRGSGLTPSRHAATGQAGPNTQVKAKVKAKARAHEVSLVLAFHVVMEHPPPTADTLKRRESEAEKRRTTAMARMAAAAGLVSPSKATTDASTNSNDTAGRGGKTKAAGHGGKARAKHGGSVPRAAGRDSAAAVRLRLQQQAQRAEDGRTHASRGEHFYHVVYNVPKGGENHPLEFDLVIFTRNATARVHTQSNVSFTVLGDVDGDGMHFIFSVTHTVKVNRNLLIRLYDHGMDVGIWCSKELVSQRASRDRPRATDASSAANTNARAPPSRLRRQPPRRTAAAEVVADRLPSAQPGRSRTPAHTQPVKPIGTKEPTNTPSEPRQAPLPPPGGVIVIPMQRMFEYDTVALVYPLDKRNAGVCAESFQNCTDFEMQSLEVLVAIEDGVLLSDIAMDELKPMKVRIERLTYMPSTPLSYEQLAAKSDGVSVKFKVPGHTLLSTTTRPHAKDITFNESHIVLLSRIPVELLREFLWGPQMVFEVHDRARKQSAIKEIQNNYGVFNPDESDFDQLYGGYIHMEQMRSVYNFADGRPPYWDPYGHANVNVDRLARGVQSFADIVPVLPGPRMSAEQKEQRRLRGIVYGDDDKPLIEGLYTEHGTLLYVSFELPKPVYIQPLCRVARQLQAKARKQPEGIAQKSAAKQEPRTKARKQPEGNTQKSAANQESQAKARKQPEANTQKSAAKQEPQAKGRKDAVVQKPKGKAQMVNKICPYSRVIIVQRPACQLMRAQIMEAVACKNIAALGLPRVQTLEEKLVVLGKFILPQKHIDNAFMDMYTGFEIADRKSTVTVLEGLSPSILELIRSLPKPKQGEEESYKILFNSKVRFSQRLYMSFPLLLGRFQLNGDASDMLMWERPYMQVPSKGTVDGVHVLTRLFSAERIEKAAQDGVFVDGPRFAEIVNLYCTASTIPGTVKQVKRANVQIQNDVQEAVRKQQEELLRAAAESRRRRRREAKRLAEEKARPRYTPIDHHNVSYDELVAMQRKAEIRDFVGKNVLSCKTDGTRTRRRLPLVRSTSATVHGDHVHIYSTQPFNRDVRRLRMWKEEMDYLALSNEKEKGAMARAKAAADGWHTAEHSVRDTTQSAQGPRRSASVGGWTYQKDATEAEEFELATSEAIHGATSTAAAAAAAQRYTTGDENGGRWQTATFDGARPRHDRAGPAEDTALPRSAQESSMAYVYADRYYLSLPTRQQCSEVDQGLSLRQEDGKQWLTREGFSLHPHKSSSESLTPAVAVGEARREELAEPWQENTLHANTLEPTVDRGHGSWDERHSDMELYRTAPSNFGAPEPPATIILAGESLLNEQKEAEAAERRQWEQTVLPSHDLSRGGKIRTHRVGASSELQDGASSQVDRLTDIRKGRAKKNSLRYRPADVPALGVVRDPGVDAVARCRDSTLEARTERACEATLHEPGEREGFVPGDRADRSIKLRMNSMPLDDTRIDHAHPKRARPTARTAAGHSDDYDYEPSEEQEQHAAEYVEFHEEFVEGDQRGASSNRGPSPYRPESPDESAESDVSDMSDAWESARRAVEMARLDDIHEAVRSPGESSPTAEAARAGTDEDIEDVEVEDAEDLDVEGAEGAGSAVEELYEEADDEDYHEDDGVEDEYDSEEDYEEDYRDDYELEEAYNIDEDDDLDAD